MSSETTTSTSSQVYTILAERVKSRMDSGASSDANKTEVLTVDDLDCDKITTGTLPDVKVARCTNVVELLREHTNVSSSIHYAHFTSQPVRLYDKVVQGFPSLDTELAIETEFGSLLKESPELWENNKFRTIKFRDVVQFPKCDFFSMSVASDCHSMERQLLRNKNGPEINHPSMYALKLRQALLAGRGAKTLVIGDMNISSFDRGKTPLFCQVAESLIRDYGRYYERIFFVIPQPHVALYFDALQELKA